MSKALEAARRAIEAHPAYDCGSTGDEEMARAAITAYLSALAGDEETVERVAAAIWEREGYIDGDFDGDGDPFRRLTWAELKDVEADYDPSVSLAKDQARAALRALTQEPKP